MALGPFEISAQQVVALDTRFTRYINRVLEAEVAAERHPAHELIVNDDETINDGGVDASVRGWTATGAFIPLGDTAFQFKRGAHGPKACADELEKATWAHEYLKTGGSYIVAIGTPLSERLLADRHEKLMEKAVELGLLDVTEVDRVRVYDANILARWGSSFTAIAVSSLVNGPGFGVEDFEQWSSGRPHHTDWVVDESRANAIASLQADLLPAGIADFRIQGESGVGKTRLVLEALRSPELSPLVIYVPNTGAFNGNVVAHLSNGRAAILVVDECPPENHVKILERLSRDAPIRLITIGPSGASTSSGPLFELSTVEKETTEEFLKANYPGLASESKAFVARHSRGNMRWTMILADKVGAVVDAPAAELIARNDIEQFVTSFLPQGRDFFCSAVLALFERVGLEGELRYQLELIASFAGATVEEMESAIALLSQNGLLTRQGRYISIAPHPLAVFLAAEAWRDLGARAAAELLPILDDDMATSFFRRVADLGQFEPAQQVLAKLLSPDAPFGSLESIKAERRGRRLTSLAIVIPERVALHLRELLEEADDEQILHLGETRRDLVWTLEKLVWHRRTFATAANSLLALALLETETYSNNATGTWLDLFGAMLPGTAALPAERLEYLRGLIGSGSAQQLLAVRAASKGLETHETIMVSGELQSGALVEPRGTPRTFGEIAEYRDSMMAILVELAHAQDGEVIAAAEAALIDAIHGLVDDQLSGDALRSSLAALGPEGQHRLRVESEKLRLLYARRRTDPPETPEDASREAAILDGIDRLLEGLPDQTDHQALRVLSELNEWDFDGSALTDRVEEIFRRLSREDVRQLLLEYSRLTNVPAAWQFGVAGGAVLGADLEMLRSMSESQLGNLGVVSGLLTRLAENDESVFDRFFELGPDWPISDLLQLGLRAPATPAMAARMSSGLHSLPVRESVYLALPWSRHMADQDVADLFMDLKARIEDQADYNATIEFLSISLHHRQALDSSLASEKLDLARLRSSFPKIGQKSWAWCKLLENTTDQFGIEICELIVSLVISNEMHLSSHDSEASLVARCAKSNPTSVWNLFAEAILNGAWSVQFAVRDWFVPAFDPSIVTDWVGSDVERARVAAEIAPADQEEPSAIVQFLLEHFDDERVSSRVYGSFISGFWTGSESDRIRRQLGHLEHWRRSSTSAQVRSWAKKAVASMESRLENVIREEAEERF